jgi:hypothetical protein
MAEQAVADGVAAPARDGRAASRRGPRGRRTRPGTATAAVAENRRAAGTTEPEDMFAA